MLPDGRRYASLEIVVDRTGMGVWYGIIVNGVTIWAHSAAMDGPIDPTEEAMFENLWQWSVSHLPEGGEDAEVSS